MPGSPPSSTTRPATARRRARVELADHAHARRVIDLDVADRSRLLDRAAAPAGLASRATSSTSEFHSPHSEQRPSHFDAE
jgi:hypothetical protein